MEIVEKCKGVPLALRAIGNVLFKRTEAEWVKVKNNIVKYITQQESGIMPVLKLSYDHLPPHLRQCFAYCSLILKDTEFWVEDLIMYWMAQGFIQPLSGDEDLEDVGHEYFMDLLWKSFFQVAEEDDSGNVKRFTMHDLMHDLACSVAGTEYCIASLEAEMQMKELAMCSLRSLNFEFLRLQNLQTLHLSGCSDLEKLPRKTIRLVSLRYLYIDGCGSLAYMPRGLGLLTCLRTLNEFIVGKRGKGVGELRELNGLNNLKGKIRISSLKNAIPEPGSSYLKEKLNLKHLKLSWRNEENDDDEEEEEDDDASNEKSELVFEGFEPHPNLEMLVVYGYPGSKISSWLSSITNLTRLILEDCVECKHLPPLHQLSFLKFLRLSGLKVLENVSEIEMQKELSSKSTKFFPSFEELDLMNCPNLKGWWSGDVDEASNAQLAYFRCLSDLTIRQCPNLTSMPLFPSVRELRLNETSWKQLQKTMKLKMTTSEEPSSSSLFPPFSKLTKMWLVDIEELDSLPEEFLQNQTSLWSLYIASSSNLTSMPKGMRFLTSLQELSIWGCPQLSERCQRDIGVEWPNIAHIGNICIDGRVI
ncbi:putative disease resistance protein RGA4 [Durio zibethinus]|uniref:Disease resistance protein RGA4 n=1 Tax=Durio zibethinus TaxID=66656 RepID=A0A6P5X1D5_DURZI|nr:putative disease resistance protein RGA4 [Durio zibethinus]